ncbi:hypothetical protein WJR50_02320 [Catalinimonas sp. 4WD22]|uniref:hypothetical protein n=1 Tax=Catalinimonas locisalis TaxID=3133978 RepID=UPI003100FA18
MKRKTLSSMHITAAGLAMTLIFTFFSSSLIAELIGDEVIIMKVKTGIFYMLPLMLFLMPALGLSGKKLAGKSKAPLIQRKMRRMRWIAINGGILILLAVLLYQRAENGRIDTTFMQLQIAELLIGVTNLFLMGLMVRDGKRLAGKKKNIALTRV